ncbi:MAG: hypothetical protein ACYTEX_27925 [Planctomycetota bacterium]|jgi:hypothetical protein
MDALKDLRRLEREATEGPWEVDHLGVFKAPPAPHLSRKVRICQVSHKRDDVLIAALRNAAPALIDDALAYHRLRKALGELPRYTVTEDCTGGTNEVNDWDGEHVRHDDIRRALGDDS